MLAQANKTNINRADSHCKKHCNKQRKTSQTGILFSCWAAAQVYSSVPMLVACNFCSAIYCSGPRFARSGIETQGIRPAALVSHEAASSL